MNGLFQDLVCGPHIFDRQLYRQTLSFIDTEKDEKDLSWFSSPIRPGSAALHMK